MNNNNNITYNNNPLDAVFNPTSENNDNINPTPDTHVARTTLHSNDDTNNGTSVTVGNSGGPVDNNQQNVNLKLSPTILDLSSCRSRKAYANRVHRQSVIASPYTKYQLRKALRILNYHQATSHKSFAKIKEEIKRGALIDIEDLTELDVDICIDLFGPCPQCLAGSMRNNPQSSNIIPDTALPGQYWEIDYVHHFYSNSAKKKSSILAVCIKSGYLIYIPVESRSSADAVKAGASFNKYLKAHFPNAVRSNDIHIFSDHETALKSFCEPTLGCKPHPRPIGDHANRVERWIGIIEQRANSTVQDVLDTYGIVTPGVLYPRLYAHIVKLLNYEAKDCLNGISPNEYLFGKKLSIKDASAAKFGTIVMAKVPPAQLVGRKGHDMSARVAMICGFESQSPKNLYVWDPSVPDKILHRSHVEAIKITEPYKALFNKHSDQLHIRTNSTSKKSAILGRDMEVNQLAQLLPQSYVDSTLNASVPQPIIDQANNIFNVAALTESSTNTDYISHAIDENSMSIDEMINVFGRAAAKAAVHEEMQNLFEEQRTRAAALQFLKPENIDKSKQILPSKGFGKAKYKNGKFSKLKFRLTGGGHRQRDGTYGTTSAPTVDMANVFLVCSLCKKYKLRISCVDIPGAYLHADLPEDERVQIRFSRKVSAVMVELDPSLKEYLNSDGTLVALALKAIYGLKQAGARWHDRISEVLLSIGFKRSKVDAALFYRKRDVAMQIVSLHVDDLFHACNSASFASELESKLSEVFGELKWERDTIDYLSVHFVQQDDYTVHADMTAMIQRILTKAGVSQPAKTPSSTNLFEAMDDENVDYSADTTRFRSSVAELIYLTKLRVDIIMEVTHLATLVMNPGPIAFKKLERVHRYLFATSHDYVKFGTDQLVLQVFADSSYASHPATSRSHGGRIVRLGPGSGAIYSKSKEHKLVTQSSTEAEILEAGEGARTGLPFARILHELGVFAKVQFVLFQDNQSTLHLAQTGEGYAGKAKHFRVRFHFIKEMIEDGEMILVYCPTGKMLADFLTKSLPSAQFILLRDVAMGRTLFPSND